MTLQNFRAKEDEIFEEKFSFWVDNAGLKPVVKEYIHSMQERLLADFRENTRVKKYKKDWMSEHTPIATGQMSMWNQALSSVSQAQEGYITK